MRFVGRQRLRWTLSALLLAWLATPPARAEDVTTLSGQTYRQVRTVRVDPDGVVWQHATGQCKVDFTDLPESVRQAYHYDARRAAAFQAAQAQATQQTVAQTQQGQQEAATRQAARLQAQENAPTESGTFVRRHNAVTESGVQSVAEGLAAKQAARDLLTSGDGTIWDRRLWAVPSFLLGGYSPGDHFDPHTDLNAHEFQASLHHGPGSIAVDSAHDSFFQPDYSTKAYYQDVERAEAFARGRP